MPSKNDERMTWKTETWSIMWGHNYYCGLLQPKLTSNIATYELFQPYLLASILNLQEGVVTWIHGPPKKKRNFCFRFTWNVGFRGVFELKVKPSRANALRIQIWSDHHEMTQVIQVQWILACHVKQKSSKPQILHCGSRSSVPGTARAAGVELLWPKAAESASVSARWLTGKVHRFFQIHPHACL